MFGLTTCLLVCVGVGVSNSDATTDGSHTAWAGYLAQPMDLEAAIVKTGTYRLSRNKSGEAAEFPTTFNVLYDKSNVYLTVRCEEPDRDHLRISDDPDSLEIWQDDSVEIFFDPGLTRSRYVQILVGAGGQTVIGYNGVYERLTEAQWKVDRGNNAWTMVLKVPFDTLRAHPATGDVWGFNVYRTRRSTAKDAKQEQQGWNPTRDGYRMPHRFGQLVFGEPFDRDATVESNVQKRIIAQVERDLAGTGRWTREDMTEQMAHERTTRLIALSGRMARLKEPALIATTPAITDEAVFPWTVPARDALDPVITMAACREEFEPASFILFATRHLADVAIEVGKVTHTDGEHSLSSDVVDVRQVVCWYQSGWPHVTRMRNVLIPELLVKDGAPFKVDSARRINVLGFDGYPEDSDTLQPFGMRPFESKQIWLTFQPPADAQPGTYKSSITIKENGLPIAHVPLRLTVYPFKLARSILDYSLYYRLRPSRTPDPVATMKRMAHEVRNQVEHGINMPSTYIGSEPLRPDGESMETLEELTRIYRESGLVDHPLILVTMAVGRQSKPEELQRIRDMANRMVTWAKARGYNDVYFQGVDEGNLDTLRKECLAFKAVNEGGGKVFVACGTDYFEAAGEVLNMPVMAGALRPDIAAKTKAAGHRPFSYANPQAGVELPDTYRRNYGLKLWAAGYDGGFDYEYQSHNPKQAYDDFAQSNWRNHTMAYPTTSGKPIDTRQWEGWREGVDDVRYLSTLLEALDAAEADNKTAEFARETRQWLKGITGNKDLVALRSEIAARILRLGG